MKESFLDHVLRLAVIAHNTSRNSEHQSAISLEKKLESP
jgi:hypothetical protein